VYLNGASEASTFSWDSNAPHGQILSDLKANFKRYFPVNQSDK